MSRLLVGILPILLSMLVACNSSDDDGGPPIADEQYIDRGIIIPIQTMNKRLDHFNVPGVSIAVIDNFQLDWASGYGVNSVQNNLKVDTNTLFQAASISKPLAAVGALKLVESGLLSLDTQVNQYLTSWQLPDNGFQETAEVTLRGILSHSAGLTVHGFAGYNTQLSLPSLINVLNGQSPANSPAIFVDTIPGSRFRYSGGGYVLLQQLMQDITGGSFDNFMEEQVLQPIAMNNSSYEQPISQAMQANIASGHRSNSSEVTGQWHNYPEQAAAGLWTTPSDLTSFAIALANAFRGESNTLLSVNSARDMLTRQKDNWGLGIKVGLNGQVVSFSHGGSNEGFRCHLFMNATTGQGLVVMTNSDVGDFLITELFDQFSTAYEW
jgi:CubicO group peptidase (beta-lactamase class C family)